MTDGVNGPGNGTLMGLALLEFEQQNRRDGKVGREMAQELAIASGQLKKIYTGLDESANRNDRIVSYIGGALSVYSMYNSASGVVSEVNMDAHIAKQPKSLSEAEIAAGAEEWPEGDDVRLEKLATQRRPGIDEPGPRTQREFERLRAYKAEYPERFQTGKDRFWGTVRAGAEELVTTVTPHQLQQWAEGNEKMREGINEVTDSRDQLVETLSEQTREDNKVIEEMAKMKPAIVKLG